MAKKKAPQWAINLRAHMRVTHQTVRVLAAQIGKAESTLRSWLNGTRTPSPPEYIDLVKKAKADIVQISNGGHRHEESIDALILNAWHFGDEATRDILKAAAESHGRRSGGKKKSNK